MKNCTTCKHADWKRTSAGKLHPSGAGRCTAKYKLPPPLPASMYWITPPCVGGGFINRREDLKEHCTYFTRIEIDVAAPEKAE